MGPTSTLNNIVFIPMVMRVDAFVKCISHFVATKKLLHDLIRFRFIRLAEMLLRCTTEIVLFIQLQCENGIGQRCPEGMLLI